MSLPFRLDYVPRMFSEGIEDDALPKSRRQRRTELLSESFRASSIRITTVLREALAGHGAPALLPLRDLILRDWILGAERLPDVGRARADAEGYCGLAHDLSPGTLIEGYAEGLLPLAYLGPVGWYAPQHRFVARPAEVAWMMLPSAFARAEFSFTFDQDFEGVAAACAEIRRGRRGRRSTGLAPRLMNAFAELHDVGHAHGFSVRDSDGGLLGGGFGVAVGRCFLVHSRFERIADAAKAALVLLARHLVAWQFARLEVRQPDDVREPGFKPVTAAKFREVLATHRRGGKPGRWSAVPPLARFLTD